MAVPSTRFAWAVIAGIAAYTVYFAWRLRECFVDDAYIVLHYLQNLLAGHAFVFHSGGPAVEGVTNVGWLLFLAPMATIVGPAAAAKLLGLLLVVTALVMTLRFSQHLAAAGGWGRAGQGAERPAPGPCGVQPTTTEPGTRHVHIVAAMALVPVLLLASSFDFLYFSLAGMETGLLAVLLLVMGWITLRRPDSFWLPVLGVFAFLVHPEAIVVFPLYTLLVLATAKVDQRRLMLGNLLLVVLVGIATAIRYAYFHDVLPNTFHSKPSNFSRIVAGTFSFLLGQNVNIPFPITGWLALPVLVLGYLRLGRAAPAATAMLAAVTGVGVAFGLYSLPDWTEMGRYFAPYLPAALILFWAGLFEAISRLLSRMPQPTLRDATVIVVMVSLVLVGTFDGMKKLARMDDFPGYVLASRNLVGPSLWIRDNLPEEATIATRRIGALAYFSEKAIFDYTSGLPDREVARLVAASGRRFNLPTDPALAEVWSARSPDYLLEDAEMIDLIASQSAGTRRRFTIHGIPYGVIRSFPIGRQKHWVLARRLEGEQEDSSPLATHHGEPRRFQHAAW